MARRTLRLFGPSSDDLSNMTNDLSGDFSIVDSEERSDITALVFIPPALFNTHRACRDPSLSSNAMGFFRHSLEELYEKETSGKKFIMNSKGDAPTLIVAVCGALAGYAAFRDFLSRDLRLSCVVRGKEGLVEAANRLVKVTSPPGRNVCAICGATNIGDTAIQLLEHSSLFHVQNAITKGHPDYPRDIKCSFCGVSGAEKIGNICHHYYSHIHKSNWRERGRATLVAAAVVIRPSDGEMLLVHEVQSHGWYLPAGLVDPGESFMEAAIREAHEEAGINIRLTGVLAIEHASRETDEHIKVVFLAAPECDDGGTSDPPKALPDEETAASAWAPLEDIFAGDGRIKMRNGEPGVWARRLKEGSYFVAPLDFVKSMGRVR